MRNYRDLTKKLCFTAVFAAMTCVCTMIYIPLPFGYFNLGDAVVLVGAYLLCSEYGVWSGMVSAALGAALADLFSGYAIYVPATALIKALMALVAFLIFKELSKLFVGKRSAFGVIPRLISSIAAEAVMVGGYLLYELALYGAGAVASVVGNVMQGVCAVVISTVIMGALRLYRVIDKKKK